MSSATAISARGGTRTRYLLAAASALIAGIAAARCSSPTQPIPPPPANSAPVIRAVNVTKDQVEAGQDVDATVDVQDAETPIDQLTYEWKADGGTFTGQGRSVKWTSPKN